MRHPHITVGYDQNSGHAILAPVTNAALPGFGPRIPASEMGVHRLQGNVLLNTVTAHPNQIHRGAGQFAGARVGQNALAAIQQGK